MKALRTTAFIAMISLCATRLYSADCTAISTGDWTDPSTWSCGSQPGCGDIITIPAGITVTLDEHVNLDEESMPPCFDPVTVIIYGILDFSTGKKMYLSCGSTVEVMVGGEIQPGVGGGSSNLLYICQQEEWKAEDGPVYGYKLFGDPIPLSLDYGGMELSIVNETILCDWIVKSESNIDHFEIRISRDGHTWSDATIVPSIGNHHDTYNYQTTVSILDIKSMRYYVELSFTNNDGKSSWLETKMIEVKSNNFEIYPNPVLDNQKLNLRADQGMDQIHTLFIYSIDGKLISEISMSSFTEQSTIEINTDMLEKGQYILTVNGEKDKSYRFIKQ